MHRRRSTPGVSHLPPSGRVWTVRDAHRRHVSWTQTNECDILRYLQDTCNGFPEQVAILKTHSNNAEIKLRPAYSMVLKKKNRPTAWGPGLCRRSHFIQANYKNWLLISRFPALWPDPCSLSM